MNIMLRVKLLCFLFFVCGQLFAQGIAIQQTVDRYALEYQQEVYNQAAPYYGRLQSPLPRATNHPYLGEAQYAKSRLSYLGVVYPEVFLRLDISRDELIIFSPDFRNIVMIPENLDFVVLHGQHIIYFSHDELPGSPSSGYYSLLHSENCKVLKKQNAVLAIDQSTQTQHYLFSTRFFVYKDGVYYSIRSQRALLNAMQPYKKELRRFISTNRLSYRNNTDAFITQIVREYEKLSGL